MVKLNDRLSLKTMKLIAGIERHGNLSLAAEELHIVVSAASRRIRFLEDSLGFRLIERAGRGIGLTVPGRAIATHAHKILADIDQLEGELQDITDGVLEQIRLSVSGPALFHDLPEQLRTFLGSYPYVRLSVEEQTSNAVAESVLDGRAELGILLGAEVSPGLRLRPYRCDALGIVVPPAHPLAGRTTVRFAELLDQDWVLPPDSAIGNLLAQKAASHGAELVTRIRVHGIASTSRVVQGGLGITVLPMRSAAREVASRGLVSIPLAESWASCNLHLATLRNAILSPAMAALVDILTAQPERSVRPPVCSSGPDLGGR
ncbi:conserved hypothetical protein [Bosea sp. 62]|uniref:LysR family transcriptional regulator n=1 Tax=unclassified Bosea (in: a-proteobacteria) TaxID=2653178 RepID=UPI00125C2D1E|nr:MULTISPECIES: LysR family transcriptional regulator [unclassified Bosea (in: a-proteobacteria)]CAD5251805.1 conserved hypothetical protein [Bosea sp. 21B]CAD5261410.1 conserved hypothetical protein [Bosea sp. 7B]CAD5273280.1 conserved hypothetical protein [Bosea sp. 46]VVT43445.1 conserved hypothetical protein [Bosea sp. EC-HK365B]VXB26757.1 conserved hypothetical protein [Bosea sp. 29B]